MSQHQKSEISDRFVLLRKRLKMNQTDFGALLGGISNDWVSKIEKGHANPGGATLQLFEELEQRQNTNSKSVKPGVELREKPAEYNTTEQCRERIKELEAEVARLWRMIEASRPQGISYGRRPSEAARLAAQAGAADDLENPPPPK